MAYFQPGVSGNPATRFKPGNPYRWQPGGQSPNPTGCVSKSRREFNRLFIDALAAGGTPEEAADLVWKAARAAEPWAIQLIFAKLAPETPSLRLIHEKGDNEFDYSRLSDQQIEQLENILEQAEPLALADGEGAPEPV